MALLSSIIHKKMTLCHIHHKGIVSHLGTKRVPENSKSSTMNDLETGDSYARFAGYQFDNNRKAELTIWHNTFAFETFPAPVRQTRLKLFKIGYGVVI